MKTRPRVSVQIVAFLLIPFLFYGVYAKKYTLWFIGLVALFTLVIGSGTIPVPAWIIAIYIAPFLLLYT